MIEHTATPWETSVLSTGLEWAVCMAGGGDQIAMGLTEVDANRIVACVNACADIPTEALTAVQWQLAPKIGAKPTDVAKLLLKMEQYREALEKIAARSMAQEIESAYELAAKHNNSIRDAQEALRT